MKLNDLIHRTRWRYMNERGKRRERERLVMAIHAILDIVDACVFLFTLGRWTSDLSMTWLFSDLAEDIKNC